MRKTWRELSEGGCMLIFILPLWTLLRQGRWFSHSAKYTLLLEEYMVSSQDSDDRLTKLSDISCLCRGYLISSPCSDLLTNTYLLLSNLQTVLYWYVAMCQTHATSGVSQICVPVECICIGKCTLCIRTKVPRLSVSGQWSLVSNHLSGEWSQMKMFQMNADGCSPLPLNDMNHAQVQFPMKLCQSQSLQQLLPS